MGTYRRRESTETPLSDKNYLKIKGAKEKKQLFRSIRRLFSQKPACREPDETRRQAPERTDAQQADFLMA